MDRIARRDGAALRPHVEQSLPRLKGFAWGMRLSVWCGEEGGSAGGKAPTHAGLPSAFARLREPVVRLEVCRAWKVPPVAARRRAAVRSAIPTLLLSGEYDPYTPPGWAEVAARTLPNSRTVMMRGMGHAPTQAWDQPCAMRAAAAFVEDPARDPSRGPAADCLAAGKAPAFQTATPPP